MNELKPDDIKYEKARYVIIIDIIPIPNPLKKDLPIRYSVILSDMEKQESFLIQEFNSNEIEDMDKYIESLGKSWGLPVFFKDKQINRK